jgi:hypothetical protein
MLTDPKKILTHDKKVDEENKIYKNFGGGGISS